MFIGPPRTIKKSARGAVALPWPASPAGSTGNLRWSNLSTGPGVCRNYPQLPRRGPPPGRIFWFENFWRKRRQGGSTRDSNFEKISPRSIFDAGGVGVPSRGLGSGAENLWAGGGGWRWGLGPGLRTWQGWARQVSQAGSGAGGWRMVNSGVGSGAT